MPALVAVMPLTDWVEEGAYIRRVKALFHWFLVAFMAMNLTWGHDWVHFPQLWSHFQEHLEEEGDTSFMQFMVMHYAERDHPHNDRSHEDLPFQHHHHGAGVDFGATKLAAAEPLRAVSFPELNGERDHPLPNREDLRMGHASELLRPPRARA